MKLWRALKVPPIHSCLAVRVVKNRLLSGFSRKPKTISRQEGACLEVNEGDTPIPKSASLSFTEE
jgi:hypothetical protein